MEIRAEKRRREKHSEGRSRVQPDTWIQGEMDDTSSQSFIARKCLSFCFFSMLLAFLPCFAFFFSSSFLFFSFHFFVHLLFSSLLFSPSQTGTQRFGEWDADIDFLASKDFFSSSLIIVPRGNRFLAAEEGFVFVATVMIIEEKRQKERKQTSDKAIRKKEKKTADV